MILGVASRRCVGANIYGEYFTIILGLNILIKRPIPSSSRRCASIDPSSVAVPFVRRLMSVMVGEAGSDVHKSSTEDLGFGLC